MKVILKPIYEMITGKYMLFENIILNYISLGVVGIIAFSIAWDIVGKLYRSSIIQGKTLGSLVHWTIRLISFIVCFYIFTLFIWLIKNIIIVLISIGIVLIGYICYKKISKKNEMFNNYLKDEFKKILNQMSSSIAIGRRALAEELSSKGLLNSGVAFQMEKNLIEQKLGESITKISEVLCNANQNFNNKLNKRESEYYTKALSENICNIVNKYYKELRDKGKNANYYLNNEISMWSRSTELNVNSKIKDIFQKRVLIDSGKRIEHIVWIEIILSIISIIEGAISIYLSIKK